MPIENEFVTLTPYDQQMAEIQRRQRMAELMQQQAMQPLETPQSGGRMIAKVSPLAGLAKMLQTYVSTKSLTDVEKQRGAVEKQGRQEAMDWMDSLQRGKQAFVGQGLTPDQAMEASLSSTPTQPMGQNVQQPYTPQERTGQINKAMFSGNPNMRMAAQLAASQKTPTAMDYYNKIDPEKFTSDSRKAFEATVLAGKPDISVLQQVPPKAEKVPQTQIEQLQEYRARLAQANPQDPRIAQVDAMISKETTHTPAVNVTYGAPVAGEDPQGNKVFFQPAKGGGAPAIIPGVTPPKDGSKLTEGESQASYNIDRIINSASSISRISKGKLAVEKPSLLETGASLLGKTATTAAQSPARQQISGAQADMLDALITLATGMSYTKEQKDAAVKAYLPTYGEDETTVAEKKARLYGAIQAAKVRAGKAWTPEKDIQVKTAFGLIGAPAQGDEPPPGAVRRVK